MNTSVVASSKCVSAGWRRGERVGKGAIQDGCSRGCGGSCASYVPPPFTVSASSLVVDCGGGGGWGGGGGVEAAMQGQGVWW